MLLDASTIRKFNFVLRFGSQCKRIGPPLVRLELIQVENYREHRLRRTETRKAALI